MNHVITLLLLPVALLHALSIRLDHLLFPPLRGAAAPVVQSLRAAAPSIGLKPPPLQTLSTVTLRKLAQQQGLRQVGGTRTSKARRAALLCALLEQPKNDRWVAATCS